MKRTMGDIDQLAKDNFKYKERLVQLMSDNSALEEKFAKESELRDILGRQLVHLNNDHEALKKQLDFLTTQLTALVAENSTLAKTNAELKKQNAEQKTVLASINGIIHQYH